MPPRRLPSFRAVGDQVLFNYGVLRDRTPSEIEDTLLDCEFLWSSDDPHDLLVKSARSRIGNQSIYYRTATAAEAPAFVNCSSFIQWAWGSALGVDLPFRAIQQLHFGERIMDFKYSLKVGDLLFKEGTHNYWDYQEPNLKIGHVGMVTDVDSPEGGVIHATAKENGVVEVPLNEFLKKNGGCVAGCRIVPDLSQWKVLNIPNKLLWRIRESDDVKILLFEKMPAKSP